MGGGGVDGDRALSASLYRHHPGASGWHRLVGWQQHSLARTVSTFTQAASSDRSRAEGRTAHAGRATRRHLSPRMAFLPKPLHGSGLERTGLGNACRAPGISSLNWTAAPLLPSWAVLASSGVPAPGLLANVSSLPAGPWTQHSGSPSTPRTSCLSHAAGFTCLPALRCHVSAVNRACGQPGSLPCHQCPSTASKTNQRLKECRTNELPVPGNCWASRDRGGSVPGKPPEGGGRVPQPAEMVTPCPEGRWVDLPNQHACPVPGWPWTGTTVNPGARLGSRNTRLVPLIQELVTRCHQCPVAESRPRGKQNPTSAILPAWQSQGTVPNTRQHRDQIKMLPFH